MDYYKPHKSYNPDWGYYTGSILNKAGSVCKLEYKWRLSDGTRRRNPKPPKPTSAVEPVTINVLTGKVKEKHKVVKVKRTPNVMLVSGNVRPAFRRRGM